MRSVVEKLRLGGLAVLLVGWSVSAAAADDALSIYSISVGDVLQLDILDDTAEAYPLVVGNDGGVQLPLLGSLAIAGMRLADAHAAIDAAYRDGEMFLEPHTDLSVITLRPFSVLGDVQEPGFFAYRADITVEQAIGLAGGLMREPGGAEMRSLQRIALRGERAATEDAIVREAITAERLRVQLADRTQIDPAQVQPEGIAQPDQALIMELIAQDEEIIAAERRNYTAERDLLAQVISEIGAQIALMEKQVEAQISQIGSYSEELENSGRLMDRGLMSLSARNGLLREVADEETALLRLRTALIATQRELTQNQREMLGLDYRRAQGWRLDLADSHVRDSQLRETRNSLLERLAVLQDWSRRSAEGDMGIRLELTLRRRAADGSLQTMSATDTSLVLPGDVLIVTTIRDLPGLTASAATTSITR